MCFSSQKGDTLIIIINVECPQKNKTVCFLNFIRSKLITCLDDQVKVLAETRKIPTT